MNSNPNIEIKSIEIYMGYDFEQENCLLCRKSLSAPPIQDLNNEKKQLIDMTIISGKCGHLYHKKCINQFKKTMMSCPQCNLVWNEEYLLSPEIKIE
jgi:hypothetical protein